MTNKKQRLQVLRQINHLHDNHCEQCPHQNAQIVSACAGCPVKEKLFELGTELNLLVHKKRQLAHSVLS